MWHRLRNNLYCVEWGVKLYSNQPTINVAKLCHIKLESSSEFLL